MTLTHLPDIESIAPLAAAPQSSDFQCELAAWSVLKLGLPELLELRKRPDQRFPAHITPQFLKNSDDQTVASLAALYATIERLPGSANDRETLDFQKWGVVSASRHIGRGTFAAMLNRYKSDGPWGVSVQVIPHNLLHSVSSTISLALRCHGPCLGAGGGVNGELDALLIASNLLSDSQLPGVWVTWSYWDPELRIDTTGRPVSESHCVVAALALRPLSAKTPKRGDLLRIGERPRFPAPESTATSRGFTRLGIPLPVVPKPINLGGLLLELERLQPQTFDVSCELSGSLELEITRQTAL